MYLVAGHFKFKADSHTRAVEMMETIVSIGRTESGIHKYTFYPDPDREYSHFLFEQWDSKEAHDKHFERKEMQDIIPEFFPFLMKMRMSPTLMQR